MSRGRQSITFTGEGAETLERLASERGVSVSEIVRQAVALADWRYKIESSGQRIFTGKEKDSSHEVRFVAR